MIEKYKNEIVFFCNTENTLDQEVLMYARNHFKNVREIDLSSYMPTGTRLLEIASHLGIPLSELVNKHSKVYPQYKDQLLEMGDRDIIQVLQHNPSLIHTPIVVTRDRGALIRSLGQMMEFADTNVLVH